MKRIGLIDVDGTGTFPNIPLMKISAYHKSLGDEVEWYSPWNGRYDEVYMSKVFSFTPDFEDAINADIVHRGGGLDTASNSLMVKRFSIKAMTPSYRMR